MANILIIKFGALGDVIRTSYILPGLCNKYKDAKIHWLTASASFDLLRYNPYIDEIITPDFKKNVLFETEFDLLISLDDEAEILKMMGVIKHKDIIGAYLKNSSITYTENASTWFDMGLISRFGKEKADELKKLNIREHNQIFAAMLGVEIKEPIFYNSPVIEKRMSILFDQTYFNVGLNSGAGSRWVSKQLPINETVKLIREILSQKINGKDTRIYLLGGREEKERHSFISNSVLSDRIVDLGNDNSLLEFAAIIKGCNYVISSDSLALHLAISQRVRNLSFYVPTSAAEIGTFGTGVKIASTADDYCSYRPDADNSKMTADRLLKVMKMDLNF